MNFAKKFRISEKQILIAILLVGLFFRIYHFRYLYTFDHDQDLSAWIVKDILVDHHPRLIGQLTSIDSVFVGPLYYYLLAIFFALFKMNPLAAHVPATIIGASTIVSIYFVFSKLFSKTAGLIGAFLWATSISLVFLDRWIVPTLPTVLWSVWFLYVIFKFAKGNFKVLPIAGFLIGLIWHIHVALIPLTLLFPLAIFLSGKRPKIKQLLLPILIIIALSLPLIAFESRHGFIQTKGLYQALSFQQEGQSSGINRLKMVSAGAASAFIRAVFPKTQIPYFVTFSVFAVALLYLKKQKILSTNQTVLIILWLFLNIASQQISKRDISEYYFNNLIIISVLLMANVLSAQIKNEGFKKIAVFSLLTIFLVENFFYLIKTKSVGDGYMEKKKITEIIAGDAAKNQYQCIGVNVIASFGKRVGFRYLLWQQNLNVVAGSLSVPVYNIVIPPQSLSEEIKIDGIGLIIPQQNSYVDQNVCNDPNNKLQHLLNYTQ